MHNTIQMFDIFIDISLSQFILHTVKLIRSAGIGLHRTNDISFAVLQGNGNTSHAAVVRLMDRTAYLAVG